MYTLTNAAHKVTPSKIMTSGIYTQVHTASIVLIGTMSIQEQRLKDLTCLLAFRRVINLAMLQIFCSYIHTCYCKRH